MGGNDPSGGWWQDQDGKWRQGGRPETLPAVRRSSHPAPDSESRQWLRGWPKRRVAAVLLLWFLAPLAAASTPVGDSMSILLFSFSILAVPLPIVAAKKRWSLAVVLGIVGGFDMLVTGGLGLLLVPFAIHIDGRIALAFFLASAAGVLAFMIFAAPRLLVRFESLAAIAAVSALVLIASDHSGLRFETDPNAVGPPESLDSLYFVWGFAAALLATGTIATRRMKFAPQAPTQDTTNPLRPY